MRPVSSQWVESHPTPPRQEQGLHLQSSTSAVEVLVIDHAEHPAADEPFCSLFPVPCSLAPCTSLRVYHQHMDWKSRRITTLLEAALLEDKAASDITTTLTIDPALRATATVVAKQPCVVAGIGCISALLTLYGNLKPSGRFEVVSHPEIFDGVRVKKGQAIAVIR